MSIEVSPEEAAYLLALLESRDKDLIIWNSNDEGMTEEAEERRDQCDYEMSHLEQKLDLSRLRYSLKLAAGR